MSLRITPIDRAATRYEKNVNRAAAETLMNGGTPKRLASALRTLIHGVATLVRDRPSRFTLALSYQEAKAMGAEAGTVLVKEILSDGTLKVRLATEGDLPGFAARLAESGYVQAVQSRAPRILKRFEVDCADCGAHLVGVGKNRRLCDDCRRLHMVENRKRFRQEPGARIRSYQVKLRGAAREETQPVLVPA